MNDVGGSERSTGPTPDMWGSRTVPIGYGARKVSFRYRRLNEVASPSASATDASRVVIFRRMVYRGTPQASLVEELLDTLEVSYFQAATIQIA